MAPTHPCSVAWLAAGAEPGPLEDLIGHSITYRIAVGPTAGQKLFTSQTVPPRLQGFEGDANGAVRAGGFSLHAGVDIASNQREKLERLCASSKRPSRWWAPINARNRAA